jgi:sialidase-1
MPSTRKTAQYFMCQGTMLVLLTSTAFANEDPPVGGPEISKVKLFQAGVAGYRTYRIPSIAITRKGTVLAAVAARFDGHGDWGNIDTMLRRSTDGGKTWDEQRIITDDGVNTVDNATFITDPKSDTVYLMYQISYARAYLKQSDDEGLTWSSPREITSAFEEFRTRDDFDWEVLAMGPGHGITLENGRFVVPVWLSTSRKHRPSISATVYSDDRGKTWRAGEVIVATTQRTPNPSEHMLIQLGDGRIMTNIRTESQDHRRLISISADGVTNWSEPRFDSELYEPICMGSIVRACATLKENTCVVLFSNPDSSRAPDDKNVSWGAKERRNLTVRLSHDEAETWPVSQVIEPGPSGYSDMAVAADGTVLILYENGGVDARGAFIPSSITLARFPIEMLSAVSVPNQ